MHHPTGLNIIAIGGSSGSGAVLSRLLPSLPADIPAAILVATHLARHASGYLAERLSGRGAMRIANAVDCQLIEHGHVYIAPPDRHLLVIDGTVRLGSGPRENMARPAIDPLFRSAARYHGPRVTGVVLSGYLDDGASGLRAIKSCGGTTVVQDPEDAQVEEMPLAALAASDVDHVATADALPGLLTALAQEQRSGAHTPSDALRLEVEIAAGSRLGSETLMAIADPAALSCPACNGVLSEIRGARPLRYRCQIGHGYTAQALTARSDKVNEAIRVAMRIMEERVTLVGRMARDARGAGRDAVAELYDARVSEYRGYAATLREAAVAMMRSARDVGQEN